VCVCSVTGLQLLAITTHASHNAPLLFFASPKHQGLDVYYFMTSTSSAPPLDLTRYGIEPWAGSVALHSVRQKDEPCQLPSLRDCSSGSVAGKSEGEFLRGTRQVVQKRRQRG
jgi:hypothetical protein